MRFVISSEPSVADMSKNKYAKQAEVAQKANKRLKMCEAKVAFNTEEEAFQKNQTAYRCPYCKKWHRTGAFIKLVQTLRKSKP